MTEPLSSRATIRDVSRLAGVSIKSVSRVLNNQKYVSTATRELLSMRSSVRSSKAVLPEPGALMSAYLVHGVEAVCDVGEHGHEVVPS